MKRILVVLLAGALVAGGATVALAQQAPSSAPAGAPEKSGRVRGFKVLHTEGVAVLRDGSKVAVRTQLGIIDTVTTTLITLTSPDGVKQTFAIDAQTVVRQKKQTVTVGELKAGDLAKVVGLKQGSGFTARVIKTLGKPGPRVTKLLDSIRN